jgi:hypothetical protein
LSPRPSIVPFYGGGRLKSKNFKKELNYFSSM